MKNDFPMKGAEMMVRKCINCGSIIREVDGNGKGICEYCGAVSEADYSEDYGRKIQLIDTYILFNELTTACKLSDELCHTYADQALTWRKRAEVYCRASQPNERLIGYLEDSLAKVLALDALDQAEIIQSLLTTTRRKYEEITEAQEAEREAARIKAEKEAEEESARKKREEEIIEKEEKERNLKKAGAYFLLSILLFVLGAGNCMFLLFWPGSFISLGVSVMSLCEAYNIVL